MQQNIPPRRVLLRAAERLQQSGNSDASELALQVLKHLEGRRKDNDSDDQHYNDHQCDDAGSRRPTAGRFAHSC